MRTAKQNQICQYKMVEPSMEQVHRIHEKTPSSKGRIHYAHIRRVVRYENTFERLPFGNWYCTYIRTTLTHAYNGGRT